MFYEVYTVKDNKIKINQKQGNAHSPFQNVSR